MTGDQNVDILFRLRDRVSQGLNRINQRLRITRDGLRSAGRSMAVVAAGLGAIIFAASRAGSTQRRAIAGLRAQLTALGLDYQELIPQVEGATAALQRKTNFGDEEQISALTRMLPILGDYQLAMEALPTVLDVATQFEVGLARAAEMVGRTVGLGQGSILESVSAARKEMILAAAPQERLAILAQLYSGQAEAAAEGTIQLKNAFGDLLEALKIDVALNNISTAILNFSDALGEVDAGLMERIGLALIGMFAIATVGSIAVMLILIGTASTLALAVAGIALALAAVVGGVIIFRDDIVGFFDTMQTKVDTFVESLPPVFRVPLEFILEDITELLPFGGIIGFLEMLGDPDATKLDIAVSFAKIFLPFPLNKIVQWLADGGASMIINFFTGTIPDFLNTVATWIRDHANAVLDWADGIIPDWMKRVFEWSVNTVSAVFNFVKGLIPEWLQTILEWSTSGIQIKVFAKLFGLGRSFLGRDEDGRSDTQRALEDIQARGGSIIRQAHGGIVTRPTLSLMGEAGPEAIVPLTGRADTLGGVSVTVVMPSNGVVILDNEASARRLAAALMPLIRTELRTQSPF